MALPITAAASRRSPSAATYLRRLILAVFVLSPTVAIILLSSHPSLPSSSSTHIAPSHHRRRSILVASDSCTRRLIFLSQCASDWAAIAAVAASHIRRIKLGTSRRELLFSQLSRNLSLLSSGTTPDKLSLRRFEREVKDYISSCRQLITAQKTAFDTDVKARKLKDTILAVKEQTLKVKKQGEFARLVAAEGIPKSLHCINMRLMMERMARPERYAVREKMPLPEWENSRLYHYAIFSDNVMAASVVVNSAVRNAREPWKHVFHIVTNRINLGNMQVMFGQKDYAQAHIEVRTMEEYTFLNSSYKPVHRQVESAKPQRSHSKNKMKSKKPKYLSMLNHLKFFLPDMFPKLHKILLLDDDVVVQRDVTTLLEMDIEGKVNAAIETCFGKFHPLMQQLNFSHPLIKERFHEDGCSWAYGMNLFDLQAWRREKCTERYHYWQNLNANQTLWKMGTLPAGLITFHNLTKTINKSWHVHGLGHNTNVDMNEIRNAAVVHFSGSMKPWLDIAEDRFRPLWTKYVAYDMEFIRQCNFGV